MPFKQRFKFAHRAFWRCQYSLSGCGRNAGGASGKTELGKRNNVTVFQIVCGCCNKAVVLLRVAAIKRGQGSVRQTSLHPDT